MPRTATIQARIDPEIKLKAQGILKKLHISMSEAISMYLTQVTLQKGIPFDLKIPNELTSETIRKSERGEEIHKVNTMDELFKELESWQYIIPPNSREIIRKLKNRIETLIN